MSKLAVHILATVNQPEDLARATLVYRTLRTGFPTADIHVFENRIHWDCFEAYLLLAQGARAKFHRRSAVGVYKLHDFIEEQTDYTSTPPYDRIVFCDPDVIFYENMEPSFAGDYLMKGMYIPAHVNEVYRAKEASRLHTSLLAIGSLHKMKETLEAKYFIGDFSPIGHMNPWRPSLVVDNGLRLYWDTASTVFHTVGGLAFLPEERDMYTHLHASTWLPQVARHMSSGSTLLQLHQQALTSPESLRGLWKRQEKYYKEHQNYENAVC